MMTLKQAITHNLLNIPGWRTKRKIVVIESVIGGNQDAFNGQFIINCC